MQIIINYIDFSSHIKEILLSIFILLILFTYWFFQFKYTKESVNESKFTSELFYLKKRTKAALFYNNQINNLDDLKNYTSKDDEKIEDFRKRKLIDGFSSSYSTLSSFRENKKNVSLENEELWIDYSTHKIEDGIYKVEVSKTACAILNRHTFKNSRNCYNNIFEINLKKI